jgi:two-component system, OmpR family, response regulator
MATILLVDNDSPNGAALAGALVSHGFRVDWKPDGIDARSAAMSGEHDLVAFGQMDADLDTTLDLLVALREAGLRMPVALICGHIDVEQRIRLLRAGGDDYILKPFHLEEVVARFEVLLRRTIANVPASRETLLRVGPIELDLLNRTIRCEDRSEPLQPTEFRLMEYMMRHAGQTLTRTRLFEAVWGYHFNPGTNLVDVHIGQLRKKIHGLVPRPLLKTVRGAGYAFG